MCARVGAGPNYSSKHERRFRAKRTGINATRLTTRIRPVRSTHDRVRRMRCVHDSSV